MYFRTGSVIVISQTRDKFSVFKNKHLMVGKQMKQPGRALVQGDHLWNEWTGVSAFSVKRASGM